MYHDTGQMVVREAESEAEKVEKVRVRLAEIKNVYRLRRTIGRSGLSDRRFVLEKSYGKRLLRDIGCQS